METPLNLLVAVQLWAARIRPQVQMSDIGMLVIHSGGGDGDGVRLISEMPKSR